MNRWHATEEVKQNTFIQLWEGSNERCYECRICIAAGKARTFGKFSAYLTHCWALHKTELKWDRPVTESTYERSLKKKAAASSWEWKSNPPPTPTPGEVESSSSWEDPFGGRLRTPWTRSSWQSTSAGKWAPPASWQDQPAWDYSWKSPYYEWGVPWRSDSWQQWRNAPGDWWHGSSWEPRQWAGWNEPPAEEREQEEAHRHSPRQEDPAVGGQENRNPEDRDQSMEEGKEEVQTSPEIEEEEDPCVLVAAATQDDAEEHRRRRTRSPMRPTTKVLPRPQRGEAGLMSLSLRRRQTTGLASLAEASEASSSSEISTTERRQILRIMEAMYARR